MTQMSLHDGLQYIQSCIRWDCKCRVRVIWWRVSGIA